MFAGASLQLCIHEFGTAQRRPHIFDSLFDCGNQISSPEISTIRRAGCAYQRIAGELCAALFQTLVFPPCTRMLAWFHKSRWNMPQIVSPCVVLVTTQKSSTHANSLSPGNNCVGNGLGKLPEAEQVASKRPLVLCLHLRKPCHISRDCSWWELQRLKAWDIARDGRQTSWLLGLNSSDVVRDLMMTFLHHLQTLSPTAPLRCIPT